MPLSVLPETVQGAFDILSGIKVVNGPVRVKLTYPESNRFRSSGYRISDIGSTVLQ